MQLVGAGDLQNLLTTDNDDTMLDRRPGNRYNPASGIAVDNFRIFSLVLVISSIFRRSLIFFKTMHRGNFIESTVKNQAGISGMGLSPRFYPIFTTIGFND
jgi:hypothetical protein